MFWIALLPEPGCHNASARSGAEEARGQQHAIGCWALQFTPRVALVEEAVTLEVCASLRLFGGEEALLGRVHGQALEMGCTAVAWAPTCAAAVALARAGQGNGFAQPLHVVLDALPLHVLTEVARHGATLARLGCRTLGDVRRLPRGGISRRFGKEPLQALDRAYGLRPEAFDWLALPEVFDARLELPGKVEHAAGLVFGGRRLLAQMAGWLAARHAGVRAFTLTWRYEFHRAKDSPDQEQLHIRTAELTRVTDHFARLLTEHLNKTRLAAAVEEIRLRADEVEPLEEASVSLLQEKARKAESLVQLVERLAARLGPDRVLRPVLRADHRPESLQLWLPATAIASRPAGSAPDIPHPTWLLKDPMRPATHGERPVYQGPLQVVSGPHRVDGAWWDRGPAGDASAMVRRDYYIMLSQNAGLLWVFRERGEWEAGASGRAAPSPWFLHGIFG
jgi:protein ImuB